ncbi:hypothetical protein J6590_061757 [Homalodisca vitripennis]|nr:hypothetical protein J6590_061757 [Homalodisca vitripennis]
MVTETKEKKNLKLGNWQVFLLEKLNQLYTKGDLCDVTLKFGDNTSIKAHKLVLSACTNFFDHLPATSPGIVLHMPKSMKEQHVRSIINFMYTGKLEYMSEDHKSVLSAAKQLGMTVLTELLQVQFRDCEATVLANFLIHFVHQVITDERWPTTPVFIVNVRSSIFKKTNPLTDYIFAHNVLAIHRTQFTMNFSCCVTFRPQKSYYTTHFTLGGITALMFFRCNKRTHLQPTKKPDKTPSYKKYIQKHALSAATAPPPQVSKVENSNPSLPTPPPSQEEAASPSLLLPGKKLPFWKKRSAVQLPDEFYRNVNK